MVYCAYGTRVKDSWLEPLFWVAGGALVERIAGRKPWIATVLGTIVQLIGPKLIKIEDVCAVLPPDPPEIDLYQLAVSGELYKLPDLVLNWLWAEFTTLLWQDACECIPGPDAGCPEVTAQAQSTYLSTTWREVFTPPIIFGPGDWTSIHLEIANTNHLSTHFGTTIAFFFEQELSGVWTNVKQGSVDLAHFPPTSTATRSFTRYKPLESGTNADFSSLFDPLLPLRLRFEGRRDYGTESGPWEYTLTYFVQPTGSTCGAVSDPPETPPLPPIGDDPGIPPLPGPGVGCSLEELCTKVDGLAVALRLVTSTVTLIQRQGVPLDYQYGVRHTGLTGEGAFELAGDILGLAVGVSGSPTGTTSDMDSLARTYISLGHVNLGSLDGWIRKVNLTHSEQLILGISGAVTQVQYYFKPGLTGDILELERES